MHTFHCRNVNVLDKKVLCQLCLGCGTLYGVCTVFPFWGSADLINKLFEIYYPLNLLVLRTYVAVSPEREQLISVHERLLIFLSLDGLEGMPKACKGCLSQLPRQIERNGRGFNESLKLLAPEDSYSLPHVCTGRRINHCPASSPAASFRRAILDSRL